MCLLTKQDRILMENCSRAFLSSPKEKRWKDNSFHCCSIRHQSPLSVPDPGIVTQGSPEAFKIPLRLRGPACRALTGDRQAGFRDAIHFGIPLRASPAKQLQPIVARDYFPSPDENPLFFISASIFGSPPRNAR